MARAAFSFALWAALFPVFDGFKATIQQCAEQPSFGSSTLDQIFTTDWWRDDRQKALGDPSVADEGRFDRVHPVLEEFLKDKDAGAIPTEDDVRQLFHQFNGVLDSEQKFPEPFVPATLTDKYNHVVLGAKMTDRPTGTPDYLANELYTALRGTNKRLTTMARGAGSGSLGNTTSHYAHVQCDLGEEETLELGPCVTRTLKDLPDEPTIVWFTFGHHTNFDLNLRVAENVRMGFWHKSKWILAFTSTDAILPSSSGTVYKCGARNKDYAVAKLTQLEILSTPSPGGDTEELKIQVLKDNITAVKEAAKDKQSAAYETGTYDRHYQQVMGEVALSWIRNPVVVEVKHLTVMATDMHVKNAMAQLSFGSDLMKTLRNFELPVAWILMRLRILISVRMAVHLHLSQVGDEVNLALELGTLVAG